LFSFGYRTIEDLQKNPSPLLNDNQKIGLELYQDLLAKIPREEVKQISEIVVQAAKNLLEGQEIIANTCGSYRRGKEMCGDVDVLITFDDFIDKKQFLHELVKVLKEQNLITHTLVLSEDCKKHENLSFEGIARLNNGLHRRLDIKVYPKRFYAWALMHFTGSANFNRSIRLFAKSKGFKLTDEGLFIAIRKKGETHCGANLVDCYTEEEIFKLFGMDYKPPEERDI
jgi:DNA polymerase IV (family X)